LPRLTKQHSKSKGCVYNKEIVTRFWLMLGRHKKTSISCPGTRHQHGHERNHNLEPKPET